MNLNFSTAIGDLIVHFHQFHQIAITESEIWIINNILLCSDDTFEPFEMIADILGLSLTPVDHAAIVRYAYAVNRQAQTMEKQELLSRICIN